jgi:hypothetical protein
VRVNALVTGNIDTPLYRRMLGDEATSFTGAALAIDGGATAQ